MRSQYFAMLVIGLGFVGAANEARAEDQYYWTRAGGSSPALWQADNDECRRQARVRPYSASSNAAAYRADVNRIYMDCMSAHGWKLELTSGPNRMNEKVNCKFSSSEQTQVMTAQECHNKYGKIL